MTDAKGGTGTMGSLVEGSEGRQPRTRAEVLADSIRVYRDGSVGPRLTTLRVTFPRFILAQFNTHRVFSRNTASSRAMPTTALVEAIERSEGYTPDRWPANEPGMFPSGEVPPSDRVGAAEMWRHSSDFAVNAARALLGLGVHKEIANRLLEPFLYVTAIVTATEWGNFFALRLDPHAQGEMQVLARAMADALAGSAPKVLRPGEWHLPMVDERDLLMSGYTRPQIRRISAGRVARVSFLPREIRDPWKDLELCERLIASGHMSPLEHVARPFGEGRDRRKMCGNFRGWVQLRKTIKGERVFGSRSEVEIEASKVEEGGT
jgi:hypothetical protein